MSDKEQVEENSRCNSFKERFKDFFNFNSLLTKKNSDKRLASKTAEYKNAVDKLIHKSVKDVMMPRKCIVAVEDTIEIAELQKVFLETGLTRIIVYHNSLDEIYGFIHVKDFFAACATNKPISLKKMMRKPVLVAASMGLVELCAEMKRDMVHIAVVVDECGGTEGIITLENIIEVFFGPINDEHDIHDIKEPRYQVINPYTTLMDASLVIEEVEQIIDLSLRQENPSVETIGGLVLSKAGHLPKRGDIININDLLVAEIINADNRLIKSIKLTRLE